jgi:hypothetical protein
MDGDKGSPSLTPLLHLKDIPGTTLSNTEDVPESRSFLIQEQNLGPKPLSLKCSILSKAFSKSNLRRTISFFDL